MVSTLLCSEKGLTTDGHILFGSIILHGILFRVFMAQQAVRGQPFFALDLLYILYFFFQVNWRKSVTKFSLYKTVSKGTYVQCISYHRLTKQATPQGWTKHKKTPKTRFKKMWNWRINQRFDMFWMWSAGNDRKLKLCEFEEICLEELVKQHQVN